MSFARRNNNGEPCTLRGVSTVLGGVCANQPRKRGKGGALPLYFRDTEMDKRSKIPPPEKSDNLAEIVF
jgi:hypothetical protein